MSEILSRLVQVGTVTAVDSTAHRVRVKFKDTDIISDWLYVIQHRGAELSIVPDKAGNNPSHNHLPGSYLTYWMPKVNDTVLCLYLPVFNGDGFVLGGF